MHYIYLHFIAKVLDKSKFLFLLTNNNSLSSEETGELELLQDQFPYSQAIHNLVARGSQLNDLAIKQTKLNRAAVYATDRVVLKSFITAPAGVRKQVVKKAAAPPSIAVVEKLEEVRTHESQKEIETSSKKPIKKGSEEAAVKQPIGSTPMQAPAPNTDKFVPSNLSGDELLDELFQDLDKLKKLKHGFETASANFNATTPQTTDKSPEKSDNEVNTDPKPIKKTKSGNKGIIAEIKSSKKKIKPSDPKQKEQLDIIDKFIKSKPSISKGKAGSSDSPATDLAENSSVFTDKIVSETLVEILIKQGKKEKAIEVLRKLIWKFPQKKAYFAAQIEELTN